MKTDDIRMQTFMAACSLAKAGMNKNLLVKYFPLEKKTLAQFHVSLVKERFKVSWTRGNQSYIMTRAHRLFIKMFPRNANYDFHISALDLWEFYSAYNTLYPTDGLSPNMIHYLIGIIRDEVILIKPECPSCGLPYLAHSEEFHWDSCGVCLAAKKVIQNSASAANRTA